MSQAEYIEMQDTLPLGAIIRSHTLHKDAQSEHEYEYINDASFINGDNSKTVKLFDCLKIIKSVLIILLILVAIVSMIIYAIHLFKQTKLSNDDDRTTKSAAKNEDLQKMNFVKQMASDSWNAYVKYAWGHRALKPETREAYVSERYKGATIVLSMSTLWVMNLTEQFEKGKLWIENELISNVVNVDLDCWVFDIANWYIGSLLSCYALTDDSMFAHQAKEIAHALQPAYNTSNGFPFGDINMKTRVVTDSVTYLSFASGNQIEYIYLTDISGELVFKDKIKKIRKFLKEKVAKSNGLFMNEINITTGKWTSSVSSLSFQQRDLYENLVLSYIQTGDEEAIEMYKQAMDEFDLKELFTKSRTGLLYAREYYSKTNTYGNFMHYYGCYLGSMLALGARAMEQALKKIKMIGIDQRVIENKRIKRHWYLAKSLTETCHQAEIKTQTGIAPNYFYFDDTDDATNFRRNERIYSLIGESARSYFVLWRLTHEPKYREYAWQLANAIYKHCLTKSGGYSAIEDVEQIPSRKIEHQHEYFFSTTLKYLYLTFSDDSLLSLDKWVFTREGQPLPVPKQRWQMK